MIREPLCVRDTTAAKMLDLPVERFRAYVAQGVLPGPVLIGKDERWEVETLRKVIAGQPEEPEMTWE